MMMIIAPGEGKIYSATPTGIAGTQRSTNWVTRARDRLSEPSRLWISRVEKNLGMTCSRWCASPGDHEPEIAHAVDDASRHDDGAFGAEAARPGLLESNRSGIEAGLPE
jgi:hypothetical protein